MWLLCRFVLWPLEVTDQLIQIDSYFSASVTCGLSEHLINLRLLLCCNSQKLFSQILVSEWTTGDFHSAEQKCSVLKGVLGLKGGTIFSLSHLRTICTVFLMLLSLHWIIHGKHEFIKYLSFFFFFYATIQVFIIFVCFWKVSYALKIAFIWSEVQEKQYNCEILYIFYLNIF